MKFRFFFLLHRALLENDVNYTSEITDYYLQTR